MNRPLNEVTTTEAWNIEGGWFSGDNSDGVDIYATKSLDDTTNTQSNVKEYSERLQQPQSKNRWANAITPSDELMIEDISWKTGQLTTEDTDLTAKTENAMAAW